MLYVTLPISCGQSGFLRSYQRTCRVVGSVVQPMAKQRTANPRWDAGLIFVRMAATHLSNPCSFHNLIMTSFPVVMVPRRP